MVLIAMAGTQKELAAKILKIGKSRVWMDPSKQKEVAAAITRSDIRKLIKKGYVKELPAKIKKRDASKKSRKYEGSKKGSKHSIVSAKRKWIQTVRPLRRMLKELKVAKEIDNSSYHHMRDLVKGGMFRSRSHLRLYLQQHGLLKKKE
jgi:large subunit ribosomal protein L19e